MARTTKNKVPTKRSEDSVITAFSETEKATEKAESTSHSEEERTTGRVETAGREDPLDPAQEEQEQPLEEENRPRNRPLPPLAAPVQLVVLEQAQEQEQQLEEENRPRNRPLPRPNRPHLQPNRPHLQPNRPHLPRPNHNSPLEQVPVQIPTNLLSRSRHP
jgi:hypothetical protein